MWSPSEQGSSEQGSDDDVNDQLFTIYDFVESLHQLQVPNVEIPDTCVLVNGACHGLYWFDRGRGKVDFDGLWPHGEARQETLFSTKRAAESTVREDMILKHFSNTTTGTGGNIGIDHNHHHYQAGMVCCVFVSPHPSADGNSMNTSARYLCVEGLSRLMQNLTEETSGLLLKYSPPRNGHHNLVRVIYTPYVTKVEKHECRVALSDLSSTLQKRTSTSGKTSAMVEVSLTLKRQVDAACTEIAAKKRRSSQLEVQQMILYFVDPASLTLQDDDASMLSMSMSTRSSKRRLNGPPLQLLFCSLFDATPLHRGGGGNNNNSGNIAAGQSPRGSSVGIKSPRSPREGERQDSARSIHQRSVNQSSRVLSPRGNGGGALGKVLAQSGILVGSVSIEDDGYRCPATPPPSPLQSHAEETDATIAMYDQIQHFGFYDEEPRKVKNSLKKQVQSVSYVMSPASMALVDEPPYNMDFINALLHPKSTQAERYWAKQNRAAALAARKNTPSSSPMNGMTPRSRRRRVSMLVGGNSGGISSPHPQQSPKTTNIEASSSFRSQPQRSSPTGTETTTPGSAALTTGEAYGSYHNSPAVTPTAAMSREQPTALDPQAMRRASLAGGGDGSSVGGHETCSSGGDPQGAPLSATEIRTVKSKRMGGDREVPVLPDQRHEGRILHLRDKYRSHALIDEEDQQFYQGRIRKQQIMALARQKVKKFNKGSGATTLGVGGFYTSAANSPMRQGELSSISNSNPTRPMTPSIRQDQASSSSLLSPSPAGSNRGANSHLINKGKATRPSSAMGGSNKTPVLGLSFRDDSPPRVSPIKRLRGGNRSATAMAHTSTRSNRSHNRSSRSNGTSSSSRQNQGDRPGWVGVSHVNYLKETPIHRPALSAEALHTMVRKEIPQYEEMIHDTSLMNYLVGAESFEKKKPKTRLQVSQKEIQRLQGHRKIEDVIVPDVPVVQLGNLHCSLSEEMLARRKLEGGVASRDLLKMLFDDNSDFRQMKEERERRLREEEDRLHEEEDQRMRDDEEKERQSQVLQESELAAQEQRQKSEMQTTYAAQQTREKVHAVLLVFEDLMYGQRSERLINRQEMAEGTASGIGANHLQEMVIAIPPHHVQLTAELNSLLLGVGFANRKISETTLESVIAESKLLRTTLNDGYDDDELYDDDMEAMPKVEYCLPSDPATTRKAISQARRYGDHVHTLYVKEEWAEIDRIKALMEGRGYTMYDAVMAIQKKKAQTQAGESRGELGVKFDDRGGSMSFSGRSTHHSDAPIGGGSDATSRRMRQA